MMEQSTPPMGSLIVYRQAGRGTRTSTACPNIRRYLPLSDERFTSFVTMLD